MSWSRRVAGGREREPARERFLGAGERAVLYKSKEEEEEERESKEREQ